MTQTYKEKLASEFIDKYAKHMPGTQEHMTEVAIYKEMADWWLSHIPEPTERDWAKLLTVNFGSGNIVTYPDGTSRHLLVGDVEDLSIWIGFKMAQQKAELKKVVEGLPSMCGRCMQRGANPFGECECSYENKNLIRRSDILSALEGMG